MNGLMMDYQLTLPSLLRRAEQYNAGKEIVTRLPDRSFHRITYGESCARARALAVGLKELGLQRGDRVATLCWNHYQHHEAYIGIPCGGFVLHTLNLRLHPNDLAYIATHAGDKVVIVDKSLVPLLQQFVDRTHDRARARGRGVVRGAGRRGRRRRLARSAARRERGGRDVLHERHDRAPEGRPVLAQVDDAAYARRRRRQPDGPRHLRVRRDPARGADVPRERVGLSLPRHDDRREARLPRPASRPGEPARRLRAGRRDLDRRRADDLARHSGAPGRESRASGTSRR